MSAPPAPVYRPTRLDWKPPPAIDGKNLRFNTRKQGERRRRLEAPPPVAVVAPSSGKRRSEAELLADARRRLPLFTNEDVTMDQFEAGSAVRQLRAAATQQAAARNTRSRYSGSGTQPAAAVPTTDAPIDDHRRSTRVSHHATHSFSSPVAATTTASASAEHEDDNNFTLDGVTLANGEIVNPTLKRASIDLFMLFELVAHCFGGAAQITQQQWGDIIKLMRRSTQIMEAQRQFRPNTTNDTMEGVTLSPSKKASVDEEPSAQLAEEMRKIYHAYLLPFENAVKRHKKQTAITHEDSSATSGSHSQECHPVGAHPPLATFSAEEVRRWTHAKAKSTATSSSALRTPAKPASSTHSMHGSPVKSTAPSVSPLCVSCKVDSLAPSAQCYHCQAVHHWSCLSPPLVSAPFLPWYCPDCVSDGSFGFENGDFYDLPHYEQRASEFKHAWFWKHEAKYTNKRCPYHALALAQDSPSKLNPPAKVPSGPCICDIPAAVIMQHYWNIVEGGDHAHPVTVEYGSDLDTIESGSGFPQAGLYARSGWNLNNLPKLSRSLLKHLTNISGVTSPWMYIGMCFSSFCWHAEDHYTYSINYVHQGAPKQWYGVPSHAATAFETVARQTLPHLFSRQPDLLFQMVTMVSPRVLQAKGVPVYSITQQAGEFVLTFPQAFHGGFNHGVNLAEAVNFAPADWLPYAIRSVERYRCFKRTPVFSTDMLLLSLAREPRLDAYTAAWLLPCLQHARDEEVVMREHLRAIGLSKSRRWTHTLHLELFGEDASAEEVPLKYIRGKVKSKNQSRKVAATNQCAHCKHAVHMSAVWCACRPNTLACLRHAAELCACGAQQQFLLLRVHVHELDRLVAHVRRGLDQLEPAQRRFQTRPLGAPPKEDTDEDEEAQLETVDDVAVECAQGLEDTEVPIFRATPASAKAKQTPPTTLAPSFARAPAKQSAVGTKAKHALALKQALHKNFVFLEDAQSQSTTHVVDELLTATSTSPSALERVRSAIYPIVTVATPLTRQLICAPPASVCEPVVARAESWLRRLKPVIVESFALRRAARKANPKSDSDSESDSDEDDEDEEEEEVNFNGEPPSIVAGAVGVSMASSGSSEEAEEEARLDRQLRRALKQPVFGSSSSASPSSSSRLTLPQLRELLAEGSTLIWATKHSRAVNLVYHKLSLWAQLVDRIQHAATDAVPDETKKEELTTARRLIRASAYAPIDFTAHRGKGDKSGHGAITAHVARLREEVRRTEQVSVEIEQLLGVDLAGMSVTARMDHPHLATRAELAELQERVNTLPLSFPLAQRLVALHIKMASALRRASTVLGQPLPPLISAEQVARFSPAYRPWAQTADAEIGLSAPRSVEEIAAIGDVDSAHACLVRLEAMPFKHPAFTSLAAVIGATQQLIDRARRMLFLSPAHSVARDREAFADEASLRHAESTRELGSQLSYGSLSELLAELHATPVKPRGIIRRLEKLFKDIEVWQRSAHQFIEDSVRATNSSNNPAAFTALLVELSDLQEEYDSFGVRDIPSYELFTELRHLPSFQESYRSAFLASLSLAQASNYFNFRSFVPAQWLDLLDRAFHSVHPLSEEWKGQDWAVVLAPLLLEPKVAQPKVAVATPPADVTMVDATTSAPKLKKEHANTGMTVAASATAESASGPVKLTPSKRGSEATTTPTKKVKLEAVTKDADSDANMEEESSEDSEDEDGPAEIRRSTRVVKKKVAGRTEVNADAPHPSSTPATCSPQQLPPVVLAVPVAPKPITNVAPSVSTAAHQVRLRKASLWSIHSLLVQGRLLLQQTRAQASTSPSSSAFRLQLHTCTSVLQQQVSNIEALFQLIGRLQQHMTHIQQLTSSMEALRATVGEETPERMKRRAAAGQYMERSGRTSHQHSPGPAVLLDCPYYHVDGEHCPFYTVVEVEKLYVLGKALETILGAAMPGMRQLKELYTQAYMFQLCARRLRTDPHLPMDILVRADNDAYRSLVAAHNEKLRVALKPLVVPHNPRALQDWWDSFWAEAAKKYTDEAAYHIDLPAWHGLLHAEYRIWHAESWAKDQKRMPRFTPYRTESNKWMSRPHAARPGRHHTLILHPINHATYQELAVKYLDLMDWAMRTAQCIAHLRECISCALGHEATGTPLNRGMTATMSTCGPIAERLVEEAVAKGFHCDLLRKLRQAAWSVRVLVAMAEQHPIEDLVLLLGTTEAWKSLSAAGMATNGGAGTEVVASPSASAPLSASTPSVRCDIPLFLHPLEPLSNSDDLSSALTALPLGEFDSPPWASRLRRCVIRGWKWIDQARKHVNSLSNLEAAFQNRDRDRSIVLEPTVHYDVLHEFVQKACSCLHAPPPPGAKVKIAIDPLDTPTQLWAKERRAWSPPTGCPEIKQLQDRLDTSQVWASRIRLWISQGKASFQRHAATSAAATSFVDGATTSAGSLNTPSQSRLPENVRISVPNLCKLINSGRGVLLVTKELELLQSFRQLNERWIDKLDALFQPRHLELELRNHLKSLLVPLTGEEEKAKMAAIVERTNPASIASKPRQPVPDCNGLYCICKRVYDEALFMIACDHCSGWYHGACVNVSMQSAQTLLSYLCPRCCAKSDKSKPYKFGAVTFRHARPTLTQLQSALAFLNTELVLLNPYAGELVVLEHVRSLRSVMVRAEEFKTRMRPWLKVIEDESTLAATNKEPNDQAEETSDLFTDANQLSHLKGCLRQGKRMGILFPELTALKRRYDQARLKKPDDDDSIASVAAYASGPASTQANDDTMDMMD